jgi:hypothetical protein
MENGLQIGIVVKTDWGPIPWKYWSHVQFLGSIGHTHTKTKQNASKTLNSLAILVTFPLEKNEGGPNPVREIEQLRAARIC